MTDIFGRKRIKTLEAQVGFLKNVLKHTKAIANKATDDLRIMDDLIWTAGQQPDWERIQPYFQQAYENTNLRKQAESDRIREILIPEIEKAYAP